MVNSISSRKCIICKAVKPIDDFGKNKTKALGREYFCRECNTKKSAKWRAANPAKVRAIAYASFKRNRRKTNARSIAIQHYPVRQVCSIDGCSGIGERHHVDYNKALQIVWLCKKHHWIAHREMSIEVIR